jgi:hypothetical protein
MPDYMVRFKLSKTIEIEVNNDEHYALDGNYLIRDAQKLLEKEEYAEYTKEFEMHYRGYDRPDWLATEFGVHGHHGLRWGDGRYPIYDDFSMVFPYHSNSNYQSLHLLGFTAEYDTFIQKVYSIWNQDNNSQESIDLYKKIHRYNSLYCEHYLLCERLLIENPDENILKYTNGYSIEKKQRDYYIIRKVDKCGQLNLI